MARLDDVSIMQYVDGELDQRDVPEIQRLLADDPAAQAREAAFRETRRLLRAAFEATDEAAAQPSVGGVVAVPSLPVGNAARGPGRSRWLMPIAASLLIFAVGGAVGFEFRTRLGESGGALSAQALSDIVSSYRVFAVDGPRTVELGPDQQALIERWFSRRLRHAVHVPDLSKHGLAFGGGRLMALDDGPVALAVYYTVDKKPVGLCLTPWQGGPTAPVADKRGDAHLVSWTSAGYLHVLVGQVEAGALMRMVDDATHALAPSGGKAL